MAEKFTAGPWEVRPSRQCIHVVSRDNAFSTGCISFDGRGRGNARLISGAPDMHKTLTRIYEAFKGDDGKEQIEAVFQAGALLRRLDVDGGHGESAPAVQPSKP